MQDRQLTKNFFLSEFGFIEPDTRLLHILQRSRDIIGKPIDITSSARTLKEHVIIYMNLYGEDWFHYIPWHSRHLPCHHTDKLRAVDCKVAGITGYELSLVFRRASEVNIGLGIGSKFCHLDIDRNKRRLTVWKYDR